MGIVPLYHRKGTTMHIYTLENHSTADLYYDVATQTLGSVSLSQALYFIMQLGVFSYTLGCMRFLEYMGLHILNTYACPHLLPWLAVVMIK